MPERMGLRGVAAGVVMVLSAGVPALDAQQQVQVLVTAVPNPVAPGTCAGIWAEVRNAQNQRLTELDGVPLQSRSYEFSLPSIQGVDWRDHDPASGYLCVQAGVPSVTIQLIATVRSTGYRGATNLVIESGPPAQVSSPNPQGYAPAPAVPGAPQPAVAASQPVYTPPPTGYAPQPVGYAPQPTSNAPQPSGYAPQQAATGDAYSPTQPVAQSTPYGPATAPAPSPSYAPQPNPSATTPGQPAAPATYASQGGPIAPAAQAAPAPTGPAAAQPSSGSTGGKGVGGFLKRFGSHIKQKAGEVTSQTAQSLAGSAEGLVDTTLQTGSGMVSTTVAGVGNTARMTIGGAGASLIPTGLRGAEPSDNLASAVAGGRAVLRAMRFMRGTAVLEPASQELAVRLAGELKKVLLASPGTYLLSAHVDPILTPAGQPIPSASQQLSEQRAATVKAVLVKNGVPPGQLIALGYGASQPLPETTPDGSSSSARIEIARTQ